MRASPPSGSFPSRIAIRAGSCSDRYSAGLDELTAPDLLIPEVANVLWKRAERGEVLLTEAKDSLKDPLALNIPVVPSSSLASPALELAATHKRSVYDCLYLALAADRGADFISSDQRLYHAVGAAFPQFKLLQSLSW